ncbi:phenylalanine--tRNA ligase subunit beta [Synechococcales cyanobacterium C]|uniref:Phenylalanine--tRNA ligase beta subunit n=1 Tax=Petrachloros mirabilis ULC683 TaxID=2781853 RepID=A0A8K2ANE3_9CYAN|nr:phenylalanine--tRNA ligase subunit beta [Petrachloros mirabilis]NCJ05586.1 phenylalanine--tRNA ligase subunit beta [Petrachloros mirabilis ULC683]
MRISLNWLRELVAIDLPPEELAEKLTLAGFEVEDIEDRRTWADRVVVGRVVDRQPHPDATKLSVCQVDIGAESVSTIVCGAPNVATGQWVAVATVGAYLPCVDLKIKPAKLRGVMSQGMICSLAELGLEKEAEGIHTFDSETLDLKLGQDVRPLLGLDDVILDLTSTANRADALSMVGVAREVAALTGAPLTLPKVPRFDEAVQSGGVTVTLADPEACPAYIATVLDSVQIGPSPAWMQRRLEAAGTRPINNVVDITNYILLEWGQPLHAFDGQALRSIASAKAKAPLTLGVRFAQSGETLTTLDSQERTLSEAALVITANNHPVALAGVMGGEDAEVSDHSRQIILEAALFSSIAVRRSARSQGLRSEASTRYERGVNETQLDAACAHALHLLQTLAGANIRSQDRADERKPTERAIELRLARIHHILGQVRDDQGAPTLLSAVQVTQHLQSLGLTLDEIKPGQVWRVTVPPHRHRDLEREIDLIEEIARLHGYDTFCETLPAQTSLGRLSVEEALTRKLRETLRGAGLTELIHYSWVKPGGESQVRVVNPLLVEFSALRTEMLTGLINAFQYNLEQGNGALNGFELGKVFWREGETLHERGAIAAILGGDPIQGQWVRSGQKEQPLSWYEAKGILEQVFSILGLSVEYRPDASNPLLHPGRTAALWSRGECLGQFGQLHPQLRQSRNLPEAVYAVELNLDQLLTQLAQTYGKATRFQPFSSFPATERDLAFFVSEDIPVAKLTQTMTKAAAQGKQKILESVTLFDQYCGASVPAGQRSLAFRLRYRAGDRTLTEEEVTPVHQAVRAALEKQFQVSLRS